MTPEPVKRATLAQTVKAVASAFIGVRRSHEHAAVTLSPVRVIAVAVVGAALLVATLIMVVKLVVG